MGENFWKVRRCMLEPVPEIFDAAKLPSAAADFHVVGRENDARDALMAADLPAVPDWCEQLCGGRGGLDAYRRSPVHSFRDGCRASRSVRFGTASTSRLEFSVRYSTGMAAAAVSAGFR